MTLVHTHTHTHTQACTYTLEILEHKQIKNQGIHNLVGGKEKRHPQIMEVMFDHDLQAIGGHPAVANVVSQPCQLSPAT